VGALLPYVTPAMFKAHPTFLDVQNLRSGSILPNDQDAALNNILVQATAAADSESDQPLAAHVKTDRKRSALLRDGRLSLHADHTPVRSPAAVTALAYGASPFQLTTVNSPQAWIEDEEQLIFELSASGSSWGPGPLQLGFGPVGGGNLYVQMTYVAGFPHTQLAAPASVGSSSVTVTDATGVFAGDVLRLWDPGLEEAVTVGPGYVTGSTTVPLVTALANSHAVGAVLSGMPADIILAVVHFGIAKLERPSPQAEENFGDAPDLNSVTPGTRSPSRTITGSAHVREFQRLLRPYNRVV
jgi:hypothetical protein